VGMERGPLSLVSAIEELLGRDFSSSGLEYGCRDSLPWPRGILYPQKLALTSPTSGGCSNGLRQRVFLIVVSWQVFTVFWNVMPCTRAEFSLWGLAVCHAYNLDRYKYRLTRLFFYNLSLFLFIATCFDLLDHHQVIYRVREGNFLFLNMKCHMKKEVSLPHP
jgi:hypothetical protein